jgi:prepilin-type N-terminal cleavage/methylation domain-containing protein
MKRKNGFTLIELLVVIAIIGLLSSLAIVSLNSARDKANDAQIKSDLAQIRTTAELDTDGSGNYSAFVVDDFSTLVPPDCSATDTNYQLIKSTDTDQTSYVAVGQLCGDTANAFCVDSSGNSKEILVTGIPIAAASVVCP